MKSLKILFDVDPNDPAEADSALAWLCILFGICLGIGGEEI